MVPAATIDTSTRSLRVSLAARASSPASHRNGIGRNVFAAMHMGCRHENRRLAIEEFVADMKNRNALLGSNVYPPLPLQADDLGNRGSVQRLKRRPVFPVDPLQSVRAHPGADIHV